MKTYRVKHVDAFTSHPFSGNPAGVVIEAKGLSDEDMQLLAREKNLPETAFVLPPTAKGADLQIRWFSPSVEVNLCGHATIAGFHALAEEGLEGMRTQGQHYFKLQTKSGILAVRVEKNFQGTTVEFELPVPKFRPKRSLSALMMKALGVRSADLDKRLPIAAWGDLFVPLKKLQKLQSLAPDFNSLKSVSKREKVRGICLFTLETVEKSSGVHSRFFAPALDINEDPVTGSANGPLGAYLFEYARPKKIPFVSRELADGRHELIGEQGFAIKRPGHVKIRVRCEQDKVQSISIAGEAVTVMNSIITF